MLPACLNHYVDALFVFLDYRERASGGLQQRGEFRFDKSRLLVRIAHVAQRRTHVHGAAGVTLIEHVVATQMNF